MRKKTSADREKPSLVQALVSQSHLTKISRISIYHESFPKLDFDKNQGGEQFFFLISKCQQNDFFQYFLQDDVARRGRVKSAISGDLLNFRYAFFTVAENFYSRWKQDQLGGPDATGMGSDTDAA